MDMWHNSNYRTQINSVKVAIRKKPCPGISIHKLTGVTAGQVVTMNLIEMEQLIELFSMVIIPDILINNTDETKLKKRPFVFEQKKVAFVPGRLTDVGQDLLLLFYQSYPEAL